MTPANCSDGDVRLVDGSVNYEGRVEVCINRVWGTICSTSYRYVYLYSSTRWDLNEARVVCRQLGHQDLGATVYTSSSTFGTGIGPVFLTDLFCTGSEASLIECRHSKVVQLGTNNFCTHSRDVGLRCERKTAIHVLKVIHFFNLTTFTLAMCSTGDVQVISSANGNSGTGRAQVCINGTWGTICNDFWENVDASIVCKQAGYSEYGMATKEYHANC